MDQATGPVEGQLDFHTLEAVPFTDQNFAAKIIRVTSLPILDAQVIMQIYASLDDLATALAFDHNPKGVVIRPAR
jgi:hypothetical protein